MNGANKILHIIGPPGFGKSTLAICVGNELISRGVVVRYIDMAQVTHQPAKQTMAEKILYQESTHSDMSNVTFDHLLSWSARRFWRNLIIFDNCDEPFNRQKDQFVDAIENLVKQSMKIKVLITSREESLYVEQSRAIKVDSLTVNKSCELLDLKSPHLLSIDEKIAISNLTGGVPLALQIVGSLLNRKLNPPSPSTIIEELRCQPISTLSPTDLQRKMRIDASISVSYNYLESRLRKIARYLSNFPGSFTKLTATTILRSISSNVIEITDEDVGSSLGSLVTRSLLEYKPHEKRYDFHHLLREFFRGVQLDNHRSERGRFILAFQYQTSHMLMVLANLFMESPKKALSLLDAERHNIQHLLRITDRPYNSSHRAYSDAVLAIDLGVSSNFLSCRFSAEELIEATSSITFVVRSKIQQLQNESQIVFNYHFYVHFINHYAYFLSMVNGSEAVAKWFKSHVRSIEYISERIVDPELQERIGTLYSEFYINLLVYERFFDEELVRVYNTRLLQKTIQLHHNSENINFACESAEKRCPYKHIGRSYYYIKDYKKSIQFLEKALEFGELGLGEQITLSLYLVESYQNSDDNEKARDAFRKTVVPIFSSVLQSPSTIVISEYRRYVRMLRYFGEVQKALELERKELNELQEIGIKGGIAEAMVAYDFANQMYDQENNSEAISMATLALRLMENDLEFYDRTKALQMRMKFVIGKAQYNNGNERESSIAFMEVIEWLTQHGATELYKKYYTESCLYLVRMFHLTYLYKCFVHKFGIALLMSAIEIGYYIIEPPLDFYAKDEEHAASNFNQFAELLSESKVKDILLPTDGRDHAVSTTVITASYESTSDENAISSASLVLSFINFFLKFALRFFIIRALINITAIIFKISIYVTQGLFCCWCSYYLCCCTHISIRFCLKALVYILYYLIFLCFSCVEIKFFGHIY